MMIILLSPSKTLDTESSLPNVTATQPALLDHTTELARVMKQKSAADIGTLMSISDKLSELNYERFQQFKTPITTDNARPCIFTFKGDVYEGLDIDQFDSAALTSAQKHLRILSGFYGLLRPMDLMQPYRLEMGIKLATTRGKNLYEFWDDRITKQLNDELATSGSDSVINLASNEYFKAIKPKQLNGRIITPVFKERKGNQLKVVAFFAKKARGMMTRHLLMNNGKLEDFSEAGYRFDESLSTEKEMVFTRKQP